MTVGEQDRSSADAFVIVASGQDAAALAPLASLDAGVRPVLVATGPDPMAVDDALEDLGARAGRILLVEGPEPGPAAEAAALLPRLESLLADDRPALVLVSGGSVAALVAIQVAVWADIPVTALAVDDLGPVESANQGAIAALVAEQTARFEDSAAGVLGAATQRLLRERTALLQVHASRSGRTSRRAAGETTSHHRSPALQLVSPVLGSGRG